MIKQVIIIRKDLKMRRGKEIAQGSHASMAWLSNRVRSPEETKFSPEEWEWLNGPFTKITLKVNSEEELREVLTAAREAGIQNVQEIVDAGKTEFGGVPTLTCAAIGPDNAAKIDAITGDLALY